MPQPPGREGLAVGLQLFVVAVEHAHEAAAVAAIRWQRGLWRLWARVGIGQGDDGHPTIIARREARASKGGAGAVTIP